MTKEKDYFRTFCTVSKALGTTLSSEKLLDLIVQSAIDTMDAKAACLFLADEQKDVFVAVAQKGLSDNYLHQKPMKARKLVKETVKAGHLHFRDAITDPRLEHHDAKKAEGIASILSVPVTVRNQTKGILSLYTAKTRDFSKDEIDFLSALADQGGIAIEHTRLLGRIQKNATLFLDLASHINSSLDIKKILNNLTVDISQALGMKGAAIRLLDKDSGDLKLVASYGLSDEFLNKGPVSSTQSAAQALKGETLLIKDATTDERIQYKKEMKKEGIVSMIVTPIKSRDEIIGVLRLYANVEREFPEDVVTMVQALAHQGALAIQNASMYLSLQKAKEDLEEDIWSHRSWF
ncbi:MAG: GAF domain-containing protein [Desulfobacterales bacterium]|jgi:GAF domain-containing protein